MTTPIYQGDVGRAIVFTVASTSLDLSTVVSSRIVVTSPLGTSAEWSHAVTTQTATSLVLTRTTTGADIADAGRHIYRIWLYGSGAALLGTTSERENEIFIRTRRVPRPEELT